MSESRHLFPLAPISAAILTIFCGNVAFAGHSPPSSDKPWFPPGLDKYETELAHGNFRSERNAKPVEINPNKVYGLAELIDIAERNNPETRVAWERARQAAAAVGLSESAYYPFLAASAAAGQ